MNNMRRKNVMEALELIEKARNILEEVKDEEQAAYNNLPESLQYGERGGTNAGERRRYRRILKLLRRNR